VTPFFILTKRRGIDMKLKDTGLTAKELKDMVKKYMVETYPRYDFIAERAEGMYLYDEKEAGRLTVGKLHKLMNLNLSDPENVLADYISGGQKNSRIVSVDADLKTGQLKKLIYENKFVKVSLTVDEDGTRNMEEDTMDKAD